MANIAYIRVSSEDQNIERQKELLKAYQIDKFFIEKVSGANIKQRIELQKMLDYVRDGDIVIVDSISRFGRSLQDLLYLINLLNDKSVQFKSIKEGDIDTTSPSGKLIFSIFSSLAEFERETIRQRQMEGIALAKLRGVYKGRKMIKIDEEDFDFYYKKWVNGEIKKKYFAKRFNISISTLDRRIRKYKK